MLSLVSPRSYATWDKYPALHAQSLRRVLPRAEICICPVFAFAPHVRHDVASSVVEYVSALHVVHTPLSANLPAPQPTHELTSDAPWFAVDLPAGQGLHSATPGSDEYFPMGQSVQSSTDVLPNAFKCFPAPHDRHVSADVAPSADEYLPLPHGQHWRPGIVNVARGLSISPAFFCTPPVKSKVNLPWPHWTHRFE